ncbi:hypothetical protein B5V89_14800 [Heyndrickxia sporothermodurans]|uniref:hypothetical protein n=1 Tax=Heyndrickxia sporothermodurans TaxID=46224 RepID=UPI000D3341B7|nr:hypothetical protein [Heyndrickxia sporothermodurans]PTY77347.1 hypothetical protein B5V89_14800 [Heyndrickxia sporothermodurans]
MSEITTVDIVKIVNEINEKNNTFLKDYLDKFFSEYLDIGFFDDLTFTGEEHTKVENAITHLIQLSTITSVQTTLKVLEEMGLVTNTPT